MRAREREVHGCACVGALVDFGNNEREHVPAALLSPKDKSNLRQFELRRITVRRRTVVADTAAAFAAVMPSYLLAHEAEALHAIQRPDHAGMTDF
eukprot:6177427-Pleurochrysis_carterae.AAC.1